MTDAEERREARAMERALRRKINQRPDEDNSAVLRYINSKNGKRKSGNIDYTEACERDYAINATRSKHLEAVDIITHYVKKAGE